MTMDDVFTRCVATPFEGRAEFLVASRLAQKGNIGYRITSHGAQNARRVQWLRTVFVMDGAGLYRQPARELHQGKGVK